VLLLVCNGECDEETDPVEVFEFCAECVTDCVTIGVELYSVVCEPVTDVVDVFELDGLGVYVAEVEVVLDRLDELVSVEDSTKDFDGLALSVNDGDSVLEEVAVTTRVW